jgi:plastocyanin
MFRFRFTVLTVLTLSMIMISPSLSSNFGLFQKAHAVTTGITLYAHFFGWNYSKPSGANPTITVVQGATVSFNLISENDTSHLFLLDFDNNGVTTDCPGTGPDKCSGNIPAMGTSSVAPFTVNSPPGNYSYYCLYHSPAYMVGKFRVLAPDYNVAANPSSLTINQGASGGSTITVSGVNGFSGTVNLAASVSSGGAIASMNPQSVILSSTMTSATSTLTISSALGQFSVTVIATSGVASHSTVVAVSGPDFSLSPSPMSLSINQGSSSTINVTLASLNGFSGSVALSATISSGGPPVTISPASVQVPSSGSSTATLTVTASNPGAYSTPVSPGSYNITLTGTMGSFSHSKIIPLTVAKPVTDGYPGGPIVIGGIVATVAIVAIAVYVLRRRPKK